MMSPRAILLVALTVALGVLPQRAAAQTDAASREVVIRVSTFSVDAISREVVFRRSTFGIDAVSREVVFNITETANDVVSREVVIFLAAGGKDVVSREVSLNLLGELTVPEGFIAHEYAQIPVAPAEFMALAVQSSPDPGYLDLFIAATTGQLGDVHDPPDDFVYQVRHHDQRLGEFLAFPASDTDPVDLAFGLDGDFGPDLYIAARHLDGFAIGDQGGGILRATPGGFLSSFYTDGTVASAPLGLARTTSAGGFTPSLAVANGAELPQSAFGLDDDGDLISWSVTGPTGFHSLAVAPGNAFGTDLFAGGGDGVVYTVDATGASSPFSAPLGAAVQAIAFSSGHGFGEWMYVLLAHGQVLRLDAMANAEVFAEGLLIQPLGNDVVRNDLTFTPVGDVLYVTDSRRGKVYALRTTVPTSQEPEIPPATRLLGNQPNPFNPRTQVRFHLARASAVDLVVYDAAGRQVRDLARHEGFQAGAHQVAWDGTDERGRAVASGVYFARFRAGDLAVTHKMVLLK